MIKDSIFLSHDVGYNFFGTTHKEVIVIMSLVVSAPTYFSEKLSLSTAFIAQNVLS